jgi:GNAT superfamily N-acetyltransferase
MDYLNQVDARFTSFEMTGGAYPQHLPELKRLYEQLFPQYAATPYLWQALSDLAAAPADSDPNFIHHLWLLCFEQQVVGMAHFCYAVRRRVGMGIYLAILPEFRKQPVGPYSRLAEAVNAITHLALADDAQRLGDEPPEGMFAEVDLEKLARQYQKYGFVILPIVYEEPRLPEGVQTFPGVQAYQFHPLHLGFFPRPPRSTAELPSTRRVRQAVLAFLVDFYGLPEDHPKVQNSLRSVSLLEE